MDRSRNKIEGKCCNCGEKEPIKILRAHLKQICLHSCIINF